MAIVFFGTMGIGLTGLVDELQHLSQIEGKEVSFVPHEIAPDWQNKVSGQNECPIQDLEIELRKRPVNKMVLVMNHNPRKFRDWLEFVKLISKRLQSKLKTVVASHLIIALKVPEQDFELRKSQVETRLLHIFNEPGLDWTDNIVHLDSENLEGFIMEIMMRAKKQRNPITSDKCAVFRVQNSCHLFNSHEMIVTATSLPDLEKQVCRGLGEINFEIFELLFYTQDKYLQPKRLINDTVFETLLQKRDLTNKRGRIALSIVVWCPRCEREITDEESHDHCELLQVAIEENDNMLEFLDTLGLREIFPVLKLEEITLDLLFDFHFEDLEKIGIKKLGHRLKLIEAIGESRSVCNEPPQAWDVEEGPTQQTGDQMPKKKSNRKLMCIPIILGVIISLINWCKKSKVVVIVTSSPKVVAVSMSLVLLTALTGTSLYYFYTQPETISTTTISTTVSSTISTVTPITSAPTTSSTLTPTTSAIPNHCSIEGFQENYFMFNTTVGGDIKLAINGGSGCQLRMLAVGWGGHGNGCGGGSGLIGYGNISISKAHSPYTVMISIDRNSSLININGTNGFSSVVITALPGQDATETKGGDGYSGGGPNCVGTVQKNCSDMHPFPDGGENGSNGIAPPVPVGNISLPGRGTWEDLSDYHMKNFLLAPGKGGKTDTKLNGTVLNGGGGGGVLINVIGPTLNLLENPTNQAPTKTTTLTTTNTKPTAASTTNKNTSTTAGRKSSVSTPSPNVFSNNGQGYGGGQGGSQTGNPGPGVVILEIVRSTPTTLKTATPQQATTTDLSISSIIAQKPTAAPSTD